jgi:16S rRNA U516 pseudouridylate synthase RsuA-like enzyme
MMCRIARDPLSWVSMEADRIEVDGRVCSMAPSSRDWMMHKPKGVLTSRGDDRGRKTVYSILPGGEKVT